MAENKHKILHKKSVQKGVKPSGTTLDYGEIAVNYNEESPFLSIRTSGTTNENYVKFIDEGAVDEKVKTVSDALAKRYGFSKFQISGETGTTVEADSVTDTVYLAEGFATDITLDATNDKVTFAVKTGTTNVTVARGDHKHDDRYYTESEVDDLLKGKSDSGHTHSSATTTTLGVVKLITGDTKNKTYVAGEAAAASHTHSQYLTGYTEQYKGTVTSVSVKGDSGLTGSGTITSSGEITLGHKTKPTSGSNLVGASSGNNYVRGIKVDAYGHVATVETGTPENTTYTFTNKDATLDWSKKVTVATVGSTDITVGLPANPNTDTATTESGHYGPSAVTKTYSGTTDKTLTWGSKIDIPSLGVDSKGHIVSGTVTTLTMPANPNTDTHHTTHMYVGDSGTTNAHTKASDPYVKVLDNTTIRDKYQLKGSGATSIESTTGGVVTITSTDESVADVTKHYKPSSSATKSAANGSLTDITNSTSGVNVVTGIKIDAAGHVCAVDSKALKSVNTNTTYTFTNKDATLDWSNKVTVATVGDTDITVGLPSQAVSKNVVGSANTSTANTTATDGNVWLNHTENDVVKSSHNIKGINNISVTASAGTITIAGPTKTDELTNNSGFITSAATVAAANSVTNKLTFTTGTTSASGAWSGTTSKTITIPSSTSHLVNNSGFITSAATVATAEKANSADKVAKTLKFGDKTFDGSSEQEITAEDLGLGKALKYCGITTTKLEDNLEVTAVTIDNQPHVAEAGCVVFCEDKEFVYNGKKWELLGAESTYKVVQTPVPNPSTGGTDINFVDTIEQDANGVIKPTRKAVRNATTAQTGVAKLVRNDLKNYTSTTASTDGLAAAAYHTHSQYLTGYTEQYKGTVTSVSPGPGLSGDGTVTNGVVTIGHADQPKTFTITYGDSGTTATGNYIRSVNIDDFGHVVSVATGTPIDDSVKSSTGTGTYYILGTDTTASTSKSAYKHSNAYVKNGALYSEGKKVLTGYTESYKGTVSGITITASDGLTGGGTISASTGVTGGTITVKHADTNTNISGDTSYGPQNDVTQAAKKTASFKIPQITLDQYGHVKDVTERTITVTDTDTNTDTKVTAVGNHYSPTSSATMSATATSVTSEYVDLTSAVQEIITGVNVDAAGHICSVNSKTITATDKDTKVTSVGNHYTPTSSATKGATSGNNYIRGIHVDAAGHVTAVATGTPTNTDTKVTAVGNHYSPASSTTMGATSGNNYIRGLYMDAAGHVVDVAIGTPKDTNTHYTGTTIVGNSSGSTVNGTATNGNVWMNHIENGSIVGRHKIVGATNVSVTADTSGNITITGPNLGGYSTTSHTHSNYFPGYDISGTDKADPDKIFDGGLWMLKQGVNLPCGSQYGELLSLPYRKLNGNTTPDFGAQILLPNGDDSTKPNSLFYRTSLSGTWNAWQEVSVVGHTHSQYLTGETYKGTVTSVGTGAGLTGGAITSTGTIKANLVSETKASAAASATTSTQSNRLYPVSLDKDGKLAVNVPWVDTDNDTKYNGATVSTMGIVKLVSGDTKNKTYADGEAAAASHTHSQYLTGYTEQYKGTVTSVGTGAGLTGGTITSTGTVKANLVSETLASTSASATTSNQSNRLYPVSLDKDGKLAVNVPWVDTDTNTDTKVTEVGNHYFPTSSTTKSASGGEVTDITNSTNGVNVVTGIKIDAAGHVCAVDSKALKSVNTNTDTKVGTIITGLSDLNVTKFYLAGSSDSGTTTSALYKNPQVYVDKGGDNTTLVSPNIVALKSLTINNPNDLYFEGLNNQPLETYIEDKLSSIGGSDGNDKVAQQISTGETYYLLGSTALTATTGTTVKNTNVYATGSGNNTKLYAPAFYQSSDERLKDFGNDVEIDFDKLKEIPKKYYTWKSDSNENQIGTSAQKLMEIYPELVSEREDGYLTVDYARLSVVALKAVDKLHDENQMLRNELKEIKKHLGL